MLIFDANLQQVNGKAAKCECISWLLNCQVSLHMSQSKYSNVGLSLPQSLSHEQEVRQSPKRVENFNKNKQKLWHVLNK